MTRPLEGIKVLDVSEQGFVPSATAALADIGADVVKVERLSGDAMRTIIASGMVPTVDGYDYQFELFNRNKRGVALDIETAEGREVFERAVRWADVYVTNQLPRVRRKLRTEPDDIFAINPKVVFARGHGQGQRGVDAEAGGYDGVSYWARGAVSHVLTEEGAPRPTQQRPALGDLPSGMFLAGAICAGLVHVMRTGQGIVVDTSLMSAAVWTLGPDLAYASMAGKQMSMPNFQDRGPLVRQYLTLDGRWVGLMMIDEARYWVQACRALAMTDLVELYSTPEARLAGRDAIWTRINDTITALTSTDLEANLRAEGCIFSFFATPIEVLHDPAVADNGYLMAHPNHESVRLAAAPMQFDDELPQVRRGGPRLGEHSTEVLREWGYDSAEVDRLIDHNVIIQAAGQLSG
jgi:crotonobetainyl-CoA:carnitine CoA-transferase CaiB-like acyl-CoA transferase